VEFKNLPAGAYELRAEVLSTDHVRGMARRRLLVARRRRAIVTLSETRRGRVVDGG
jgi:hypothetical protein